MSKHGFLAATVSICVLGSIAMPELPVTEETCVK